MQLHEVHRLQQLAGILNEIKITDPTSFESKAERFIEEHADIIDNAFKHWRFGFSDDSLIQTIYSYLEDELGEGWPLQISEPTPEEKEYNYGWTDEKDEIFTKAVRAFINKDKNYNLDEIKITNPNYKFKVGDEVFYSRVYNYPTESTKKKTIVDIVPDYDSIPSDEIRRNMSPFEGYDENTPGPFYKVVEDYFGHNMYKWLSGDHLRLWPSNVNEIKITNPGIDTAIKNCILSNSTYNEEDFDTTYNADTRLEDLVTIGRYEESVELQLNSIESKQELLDLIKQSQKTEHYDWGDDVYENEWELKKYPFEGKPGVEWTEVLVVELTILNRNYNAATVFQTRHNHISIKRYIPFDQEMKDWWEETYG